MGALSPGAPGGGDARSACWEVQRGPLVARCGGAGRPRRPALRGAGAVRGPLGGAGSRPRRPLRGRSRLVARCGGAGEPPLSAAPRQALCEEAGSAFILRVPSCAVCTVVCSWCQVIRATPSIECLIGVVRESCNLISGFAGRQAEGESGEPRRAAALCLLLPVSKSLVAPTLSPATGRADAIQGQDPGIVSSPAPPT